MSIPVILDTDIGSDIDDTWALAMLLHSPELDLKLVVSATGDTLYRAKLLAKFLERAGRSDVPVGIGLALEDESLPVRLQSDWVEDYDLSAYSGLVHQDGVQAIVDVILSSPEPVTLLCIGPAPNIAEALRREPRIAQNARFVGMHGALREGYGGSPAVVPEYNVKVHPADCRAAFEAPWPITITPLDTCGKIMLTGDLYQQVLNSPNPVARLVVENYRIWRKNQKADWAKDFDATLSSTVLYDTVAVFLCFSEQWLVMEELGVRVDDQGYTLLDETAPRMRCATAWTDLPAFERFLVERLIH